MVLSVLVLWVLLLLYSCFSNLVGGIMWLWFSVRCVIRWNFKGVILMGMLLMLVFMWFRFMVSCLNCCCLVLCLFVWWISVWVWVISFFMWKGLGRQLLVFVLIFLICLVQLLCVVRIRIGFLQFLLCQCFRMVSLFRCGRFRFRMIRL